VRIVVRYAGGDEREMDLNGEQPPKVLRLRDGAGIRSFTLRDGEGELVYEEIARREEG
jgi:hypothetical protein